MTCGAAWRQLRGQAPAAGWQGRQSPAARSRPASITGLTGHQGVRGGCEPRTVRRSVGLHVVAAARRRVALVGSGKRWCPRVIWVPLAQGADRQQHSGQKAEGRERDVAQEGGADAEARHHRAGHGREAAPADCPPQPRTAILALLQAKRGGPVSGRLSDGACSAGAAWVRQGAHPAGTHHGRVDKYVDGSRRDLHEHHHCQHQAERLHR